MSDITVNGGTDDIEVEDEHLYNRAGERIESIPVFAKELDIKTPATLASHVDKALAAGEMKPQRKQGRTLYFRVVDLAAANAKYGKQSKPKKVEAEVHESVLRDNIRLSVENATLILRVRELEELLADELSRLGQEIEAS